MLVWILAWPVAALVSLSKTLNRNCFVLWMGRKAVGPVCCVMHVKEPRTLIVKEKGACPGVSGFAPWAPSRVYYYYYYYYYSTSMLSLIGESRYHVKCFLQAIQLVSSCLSVKHIFPPLLTHVAIPRCRTESYTHSFYPRAASLWNSLSGACFPSSYDLSCFKRISIPKFSSSESIYFCHYPVPWVAFSLVKAKYA